MCLTIISGEGGTAIINLIIFVLFCHALSLVFRREFYMLSLLCYATIHRD